MTEKKTEEIDDSDVVSDEPKDMKVSTIKSPKTRQEEFWEKHLTFYKLLEFGGLFMQFIKQNLKENTDLDRATKRRIGKAIEKGRFTEEMIDYYKDYVKDAINYIDLNATKVYLKYKPKEDQPQTVEETIKHADKSQEQMQKQIKEAQKKKEEKEKTTPQASDTSSNSDSELTDDAS